MLFIRKTQYQELFTMVLEELKGQTEDNQAIQELITEGSHCYSRRWKSWLVGGVGVTRTQEPMSQSCPLGCVRFMEGTSWQGLGYGEESS